MKQLFLPNSDPEILTDERFLENLDGQPMENFYESQTADIDGIPMDTEIDGEPIQTQFDQEAHEAKFKPFGTFNAVENDQNIGKSKWELLDDPLDEVLEQSEEIEQVNINYNKPLIIRTQLVNQNNGLCTDYYSIVYCMIVYVNRLG